MRQVRGATKRRAIIFADFLSERYLRIGKRDQDCMMEKHIGKVITQQIGKEFYDRLEIYKCFNNSDSRLYADWKTTLRKFRLR